MWLSSLHGIHKKSHNNFHTACFGGISLSMQRQVKNVRTATTEPQKYMFGTVRSLKGEFVVNEVIIDTKTLEIMI